MTEPQSDHQGQPLSEPAPSHPDSPRRSGYPDWSTRRPRPVHRPGRRVGAVVIVAALFGGGTGLYLLLHDHDNGTGAGTGGAAQAAHAFIRAYNAKDEAGLAELTCAEVKEANKRAEENLEPELRALAEKMKEVQKNAKAEAKVTSVIESDTEAEVSLHIALELAGQRNEQDTTLRFTNTGGTWTMCDPEMGAADG